MTPSPHPVYHQLVSISDILNKSKHALREYPQCSGHSTPPAIQSQVNAVPNLPDEVLDIMFSFLDDKDLASVTACSRTFHSIAVRILYRCIALQHPRRSVQCLRTLAANKELARRCRTLDINWASAVLNPLRNLYRLLRSALLNLTKLTGLSLELVRSHDCLWVLRGCLFSLQSLSVSFSCDAALASYLETQPGLTELVLRGIHPLMNELVALGWSASVLRPLPFQLRPTALPNLRAIRAIHAGPDIIAAVMRDRAVSEVSVPIYADSARRTFDALQLGMATIRRLNVISFDPEAPHYLLCEIAKRFKELEALHVVLLLAQCTEEMLMGVGSVLSNFTQLQYLTFMAATPEDEQQVEDEYTIATQWYHSCPSLKTIILPHGKVWFKDRDKDRWTCLDEGEKNATS